MSLSREERDEQFAALTKTTLDAARATGLTDEQIVELTGIPFGTFHRWGRGNLGPNGPQATKVHQFFTRLNGDVARAYEIMGWTLVGSSVSEKASASPEPAIPRSIQVILRKLRDPNVSDEEKYHLTESLKTLAARKYPRRKEEGRPNATADE